MSPQFIEMYDFLDEKENERSGENGTGDVEIDPRQDDVDREDGDEERSGDGEAATS